MNYTLNSLQPDISFFPENTNLSFNDIAVFTERALQDSYNVFLLEWLLDEHKIFESVILKEEDVKLIGKDDSLNKQYDKEKKQQEKDAKREEFKNNFKAKKELFIQTIEKWFKTAWEKIKGFFAKLLEKIKQIYMDTKKKLYDSKIGEKFNYAINNITDKDFSVKCYSRGHVEELNLMAQNAAPRVVKYMMTADKYFEKEDPNIEEFKEKYSKDAIVNDIYEDEMTFDKLSDPGKFYSIIAKLDKDNTQSSIRNDITFDIFNKMSERFGIKELRENKNYILNVAFNNNDWMGTLKKNYDVAKKFISSCRNGAIKAFVTKENNYDRSLLKEYIVACNNATQVLVKLTNITNALYTRVRLNYLDVISRVIKTEKGQFKEAEA